MECRKCHGLMVSEWFFDSLDDACVWRCVNCGWVLDELIRRNRELAAAGAVPSRPRN